jgi:hypothetical protein
MTIDKYQSLKIDRVLYFFVLDVRGESKVVVVEAVGSFERL